MVQLLGLKWALLRSIRLIPRPNSPADIESRIQVGLSDIHHKAACTWSSAAVIDSEPSTGRHPKQKGRTAPDPAERTHKLMERLFTVITRRSAIQPCCPSSNSNIAKEAVKRRGVAQNNETHLVGPALHWKSSRLKIALRVL